MFCFVPSPSTHRLCCLATLFGGCGTSLAAQPETILATQIDLARLVDLAAERANVPVEYDAARLQGRITLRNQQSMPDDQLWLIANRLLASRGFTTIRHAGEVTLSVVPIGEAAGLACVDTFDAVLGEAVLGRPGFSCALFEVEDADPAKVMEAVRGHISRPGGAISQVGAGRTLLVADLTARLPMILDALERSDVPLDAVRIVRYSPVHAEAGELATTATQTRDRAVALGLAGPTGEVRTSAGETELTIISAAESVDAWLALLGELDRASPLATVVYSPGAFPLDEVAGLMEEAVGPAGLDAGGSGSPWTLVRDTLTNSILLTTTGPRHAQARALLERLQQTPASQRRIARHFPVRHRAVGEVVGVLQGLLDLGVTHGGIGQPTLPARDLATQRGLASSNAAGDRSYQRERGSEVGSFEESDPVSADGREAVPTQPEVMLATDEATNTLIALGEPRVVAQIEDLLRSIDVRQPQVMLEVVLVSLSDAQTRNLGVELAGIIKTGELRVRLASLFGLSGIAGGLPGGGIGGAGGTATVLAPEDFAIVLRALETVNHGRSLSQPRVLVGNGQAASLNSTLGQPVTSVNASDTVATTSFAGFSDAGTQVSITPRIAAGDHLLLEYSITLSAFVGESPGAGIPPPRQQNQLQSVVTIPDGHTVVVGGIELVTEGQAENRVPLLGSIPIVREAFRSRTWNDNRQRFFVFIRAEVDRGTSFEGLRHVSDGAMEEAGVDDGWPEVRPRVVR